MADTNIERISEAEVLVRQMRNLVSVYEKGKLSGPAGLEYDLSVQQINELKTTFASLRSQCIALLNEIVG